MTISRAAEKRRLEQRARQFEEENTRNLYDLNLEKSRLRTIINRIPNGVMVTNRNLEVVLHNPALMRMAEISREPENYVPIQEILDDQDLLETLRQILSGDTAEDAAVSQELSLKGRVARALSAPAPGPDSQPAGTVTVLEDITAFKQLDQMKSDFVNMVAHELRSPLVAIKQLNHVLLEEMAGPVNEKQRDFLDRVSRKIDGLLELINDLLDVAKIEAGMVVQQQVPTELQPIIEETVALLLPRAQERGIELTVHCEHLKPLQADPKHMEEIFSNLIANAINYSPGGGKVSVDARGLGEYMEIRVSDTGVGIAPEELPKIFDKFYRVKHPETRQVMGTGLGLAIVKGIVEAHHGTIEVDSVPDEGTCFRILLPMIPESDAGSDSPSQSGKSETT
jgi:signal transduction histidine kinase